MRKALPISLCSAALVAALVGPYSFIGGHGPVTPAKASGFQPTSLMSETALVSESYDAF